MQIVTEPNLPYVQENIFNFCSVEITYLLISRVMLALDLNTSVKTESLVVHRNGYICRFFFKIYLLKAKVTLKMFCNFKYLSKTR